MQTIKIHSYDNSTTESWKEFIDLWNKKEVICIDESMFYYWLEVLPPIYTGKKQIVEIDGIKLEKHCTFGFAEGRETIVDFWHEANKDCNRVYYCKRSNRLNGWG